MAHEVLLFRRHRHPAEFGIRFDREARQQFPVAIPHVDVAVLARGHHLQGAVVEQVTNRERRDDRLVGERHRARFPRRIAEVVVGIGGIHSACEVRVNRPPRGLAAVGAIGVHGSVGAGHDHVEGAAPLEVGERRRGLDRGVEVLVQRLDFAGVVA
jgi:hypothetical protein